ncbi:MAG: sugar ABC transporter permease [Spirochaetales bacterium]|nr:sugar ABC transporter permease [Spirochaetales bacterium]
MAIHRFTVLDALLYVFIFILCLSFVFPLVQQLALSISNQNVLGSKSIGIFPMGFSVDAYELLFKDRRIIQYYYNTIKYAAVGTIIMLASTSLMAFPLTFREFKGKKLVAILLTITIFFSGGLVPFYLAVLRMGLVDTMWALVLPGAITAWNVFIFRTFFMAIPDALRESAYIDGAGHFNVLYRIMLPLSKPLLATFTLFHVVGHWNDFFNALIFLRDQEKQPVQLFLRRILVLLDFREVEDTSALQMMGAISSRTVKGAAVIITITPILCIYPFLQKYFTKGILVGALKN